MKHTLLTLTITSLLAINAFADPIHDAAASGNLAGVQAELDKGVDVNVVDLGFYNLAPLHYAAGYGYKEIVELLIAEGADVDAKTTTGGTPLFNAAGGHKEIVELLIAAGADVNAQVVPGPHGFTVGDTALDFTGSSEIIDLLRKHGGKTGEELRSGMTPLHQAARDGHKEIVEQLIDKGADVNAKRGDRRTPLHFAATSGHKEIVELLISKGANVNEEDVSGNTPLHDAAQEGHKEIAELFIAKGANVNAKTRFGTTPLHGATYQGYKEIVELLIAEGANVNVWRFVDATPLMDAVVKGQKEIVELLIAAGAEVNVKRDDGETPLHRAAWRGHYATAELLITKGADMNAKTASGPNKDKTPLDFAVMKKQNEIADLLRTHGGKTSEELNALIDAAKNGDIEAVKQHLAAGADVNAKTGDGTTPLHNAAVYGHNEIAELLIANGASVNAIIVSGRNQGKTPLDLAIWRKKTETADLLRKHGGRTAEELALMPQLVYSKGPFDFSFTAKDGKTYVIEVTQDLKQWGELETIEGTGKQVKFIDPRQPLVPFKRNFYRVKLVE